MADASVPMTSKGYQILVDELKRLKTVERPKNIHDIEEARDHGAGRARDRCRRGREPRGRRSQRRRAAVVGDGLNGLTV